MEYIPILGFIWCGIKVLWAQHQLSIGAMSIDEEWPYFDQFSVSFYSTMALLAPAWVFCMIKLMRGRK